MLVIVIQVVASQDWPEVTKYAGLVCAQPHLVQNLERSTTGMVIGGISTYLRTPSEMCMTWVFICYIYNIV
jgi:hypothetical protein